MTVRAYSLHRSPTTVAVASTVLFAACYLRWAPLVPDLAAQVARAEVVRASGPNSWWTGWFGGLSLSSYSVLTPSWMAAIGVRATGALSAVAATLGFAQLVRDVPRPRAGLCAFATAAIANLVDGRITFGVGVAFAVWSLAALHRNRGLMSALLALTTYLTSPLAGLFLGLLLMAVTLVDKTRRRSAGAGAGVLITAGAVSAVFFPSAGTMPVDVTSLVLPSTYLLLVALVCPNRVVRVSVVLTFIGFVIFLVYPAAVGSNIARITWVFPLAVVACCARVSPRRMAAVVAVLLMWPVGDLVGQLRSSFQPSAQQSYYAPLLGRIRNEVLQSGGIDIGRRIEVIDSANHWASAYLSSLSLARGWDRQADRAGNAIFYGSKLTPSGYRAWLDQLAVGWVAVPATPLDYASKQEDQLIRAGLSYLTVDWTNKDWTLYRVSEPTSLAVGARVSAVGPAGIDLDATSAGYVQLRVRWSPYLTVVTPSGKPVGACVMDNGGWVQLYLHSPGIVKLTSHFQPSARLHPQDADCPSTQGKS